MGIILSLTCLKGSLRISPGTIRAIQLFKHAILIAMQTETSTTLPYTRTNLVKFLRERKLDSIAAWLLDTLGPLNVVLAQLIHAGSPLLRPSLPAAQVETITRILEDSSELHSFQVLLREAAVDGE